MRSCKLAPPESGKACKVFFFFFNFFSLHLFELRMRSKCESALINQFLRSGTSIGANIREAFYAHGKSDFVAKLQIDSGMENFTFTSTKTTCTITGVKDNTVTEIMSLRIYFF